MKKTNEAKTKTNKQQKQAMAKARLGMTASMGRRQHSNGCCSYFNDGGRFPNKSFMDKC
jgi:hypothetical protein